MRLAPPAVHGGLTCIVDPTTGALTVEGLDRAGWAALAGDLTGPPHEVNCARPAAGNDGPLFSRDGGLGGAPGAASESERTLRVARIYHGSVVDGPGRRSVVQVQGCPIRCPGFIYSPRGGADMSS